MCLCAHTINGSGSADFLRSQESLDNVSAKLTPRPSPHPPSPLKHMPIFSYGVLIQKRLGWIIQVENHKIILNFK